MQCVVVSTARLAQRHETFKKQNPHIEFQFYMGPDRLNLQPSPFVNQVLQNQEWTPSSIACAVGHVEIWRLCANQEDDFVVLEDDAKCSANFYPAIDELTQILPFGWDITLLGFNFDAFAYLKFFGAPFGIAKVTLNQQLLQENFSMIDNLSYLPTPVPLQAAWGSCGYLLSPKGARNLLSQIPFLESKIISPKGVDWAIQAQTIDGLMNGCYERMAAYVSLPPIVFVRNDNLTSTMDVKQ